MTRCSSRPTSAIPRSPTTIAPGLALLTHLAARLAPLKTRYSYRFVFAPGTIGAIAWLARNEHQASRVRHGLVLSCVGDGGGPTYKKSRRGDAFIDRAMAHVLQHASTSPTILDFFPYGYDERQYCSPGSISRSGCFSAASLALSRNITPRRTISISSGRNISARHIG